MVGANRRSPVQWLAVEVNRRLPLQWLGAVREPPVQLLFYHEIVIAKHDLIKRSPERVRKCDRFYLRHQI